MNSITSEQINFMLQLTRYICFTIVAVLVAFVIVGSIAFWQSKQGSAKSFTMFFDRAQIVRLVTVCFIVTAVTVLGLLGKIDSQGLVGILGGIVGFVLGGMNRGESREKSDNTEEK